MMTSKTANFNVDIKLKERLKMFEEIDKIANAEKLNQCNLEIKSEISYLDNSSLFNYSEIGNTKTNYYKDHNFDLPMQFKKQINETSPINITNIYKNQNPNNFLDELEGKKNYYENNEKNHYFHNDKKSPNKNNAEKQNNSFIEKNNNLKSFNNSPDNGIHSKRNLEKSNNIKNFNLKNRNYFSENFQVKDNIKTNFNLFKNNKITKKENENKSCKSPYNNSDKLSDFENNSYDYPQQIKINQKIKKSTSLENTKKIQKLNSFNSIKENNKKGLFTSNKLKSFINNHTENPFNNNISNAALVNLSSERQKFSKRKNNCESNNLDLKGPIKFSQGYIENSIKNSNHKEQRHNIIKKEVKKDFVECFDYDFYNFPLIKNIPDSKIREIDLHKNLVKQSNTSNQNLRNKNDSFTENKRLNNYLISNKSKKNINQTFDILLTRNSLNSQSRSRSRSRNYNKCNRNNSNNNKKLKEIKQNFKRSQINKTNLGDRLYNYNFYYKEKMKNKIEEEKNHIIKTSTPKITKKAKLLQRNQNNFHERLYPFSNNDENKNSNNKANCSFDNIYENKNKINTDIQNNNFEEDDENVNIIFDKDFLQKDLLNENPSAIYEFKRSHSSNDIINYSYEKKIKNKWKNKNNYNVNQYNRNIFEKKVYHDKDMNFKPMLNKKSLEIARKFGPASERLYAKKVKKNSINNLIENQVENNLVYDKSRHSPKSFFSNNYEESKKSASPCFIKNIGKDCDNNINKNLINKRHNSSKLNPLKRTNDLYKKGIEKMKKREEKSREKILKENESYKQFSYKPSINTNISSNVKKICFSYKKNFSEGKDSDNKNFKDETLILDNNLMNSPTSNHYFNSEINIDELTDNKICKDISNLSNIDKFQYIYEKNINWKKKLEKQTEILKKSEEKKKLEKFTFHPQINKKEIENDDKFIEKNLDQIHDYVNRRRANLKKQKEQEELTKRKFGLGNNFVIKPTIPKEFNLHTARKISSDRNTFNKPNINNLSQLSINNSFINNSNKSPDKKIFSNKIDNLQSNFNLYNQNFNGNNINNIRSELKIENFFNQENRLESSQDNNLDINCDENLFHINQNYQQLNEQLYCLNNKNHFKKENQIYFNFNNNNDFEQKNINDYQYNQQNFIFNKNQGIRTNQNFTKNSNNANLSHYSYYETNTNSNEKKNNVSKRNVQFFNNYENHPNYNIDNSYINNKNKETQNKNLHKEEYISNNRENMGDLIQHVSNDQAAFVNAINNLHQKLVNMNI